MLQEIRRRGLLGVGVIFFLAVGCQSSRAAELGPLRVVGETVEVPAWVTAEAFERRLGGMAGYHLLVWDDGKAAGAALFRTPVSDRELLAALEELGGKPGDALEIDSWDERKDPGSAAPDRVIEGSRVEVLVRLPDRPEPLRLEEILEDPGGEGFEMRFGGHEANIPRWHSGCLVCLFSCPGSKVGNASYTVRDYVKKTTVFSVRPDVLPTAGTPVTLLFRLLPEAA